jgi:hypothetical protein
LPGAVEQHLRHRSLNRRRGVHHREEAQQGFLKPQVGGREDVPHGGAVLVHGRHDGRDGRGWWLDDGQRPHAATRRHCGPSRPR